MSELKNKRIPLAIEAYGALSFAAVGLMSMAACAVIAFVQGENDGTASLVWLIPTGMLLFCWSLTSGLKSFKRRRALLAFELPSLTAQAVLEAAPGKKLVNAHVLPPFAGALVKAGVATDARIDPDNPTPEQHVILEDYFFAALAIDEHMREDVSDKAREDAEEEMNRRVDEVVQRLDDADKAHHRSADFRLRQAMKDGRH